MIIWVTFENPPKIKAVREYIENVFEINYSNDGVRKLLKKLKLKLLKPKVIPGCPSGKHALTLTI